MNRVDFTQEQKQQVLIGIDRFFEIYGNYDEDDHTYQMITMCLWDNDGFQIPPLYEIESSDDKELVSLKNDFEGKYRLLKAVVNFSSGKRKPFGYGIMLNYYFRLIQSVLLKLNALHEGVAPAIKHVISPLFLNDEVLTDYIYQDFDGLGNGIIKVGSIYIHPLWSANMFYEELVFEDELESLKKA